MYKSIMRISAAVALVTLVCGASFAAETKKPAGMKCPACKMTLSAKKTKEMSVAVKMKDHTMYCCAGCDMKGAHKPKTKSDKHTKM